MNDPHDALSAMLQPAALRTTLFPPTSRYHGLETATIEDADGRMTVFVRRRFVPSPERFATVKEHVVTEGERLDNITALHLGDPEQFWRVCDANAAMRPDELTETVGRRLRITLPEGVPGIPHA
jgi:hypothetical protein